MRFSERIGKRAPRVAIQLDSMDQELRNSLWNILDLYICMPLKKYQTNYLEHTPFKPLFSVLYFRFFKEPLDRLPSNKHEVISELRARFFKWDYLEVYDFIEFLINISDLPFDRVVFVTNTNRILKDELSGYRIIENQFAPVTSENEIDSIETAINNTTSNKYSGANIHLSEALSKLSDRKNPDFRNSIKESISSVESICQVIGNNPKAELGSALKVLKTKISLHGALEQGFIKLYGYTSDGDGIRHALMEEPNLGQEDALFMLVACSAFVNYLIAKANKL